MKVSRAWLQKYFDAPLPSVKELDDASTFHAFEVEEVLSDDVFDLKVLPDRACYALSHRGIASEFSAILNIPFKDPLREKLSEYPVSKKLSVNVDTKKCLRYMGAVIEGVKVGPSPEWLKTALESVGQRSINNVVDATNYVMLNIGQPLHAFDAAKSGYEITVRESSGEKFTALGGTEYAVPSGTLVIANSSQVLGVAGVKGGMAAEVNAATTSIVLESANFDGTSVRRAAQAMKLFTDSSLRFQNRPSPELCAYGMQGVIALILEIAGGTLEGVVDVYPSISTWKYLVGVSAQEVSSVLGAEYSEDEIASVFKRLGFSFSYTSIEDSIRSHFDEVLGKPYELNTSMRRDAPGKFSCSSLMSYLYTHAGVWMPSLAIEQYIFTSRISKEELRFGDMLYFSTPDGHVRYETVDYLKGTKVEGGISHNGMYLGDGTFIHAQGSPVSKVHISSMDTYELMHTLVGFGRAVSDTSEKRFVVTVPFERNDIRVKEDLIEEVGRIVGYEHVVAAQLPPRTTSVNQNRFKNIEQIKDLLVGEGYTELSTQAFAKSGEIKLANPLDVERPYLRTNLRENMKAAYAKAVLNAPLFGLDKKSVKLFEVGNVFPQSGECVMLAVSPAFPALNSRLGEPKVTDGIAEYVLADEMIEKGFEGTVAQVSMEAYSAFSNFPFVLRDIALWVPAGTNEGEVQSAISSAAGELLVRIDRFDQFTKGDQTSFAFHLVFQSHERTLTDVEVGAAMQAVNSAVAAKGWTVR